MNTFSQPVADMPAPATRFDGDGQQPRFTGIRLFTDNIEAWQAKRDLIARAQHNLDLAYFIVEVDGTTSRLMLDLIAAAARGVKIRLLADYFMTFGQAPALRTLAAVSNIEVRRYRPPTAEWLGALQAAGVDSALFARGLMTMNGALLAAAIKDNTLFPVPLVAAISALRPEPGGSRVGFALLVLATLRDHIGIDSGEPGLVKRAEQVLSTIRLVGAKGALALKVVGGLKDFLRRTHHKLLLADHREFIMGGRNLADAYQRSSLPEGCAFQDTDILAHDGRAGGCEHVVAFQALWDGATSVDITQPDPLDATPALALELLLEKAGEVESLKPAADGVGVRDLPDMAGYIVNNLPNDAGDASITKTYVSLIQEVTARGGPAVIDIVSAYVFFVDDGRDGPSLLELRESLLAAVRAGVTVNIRTNSISTTDLKPINRSAYPRLVELIDSGVNVFELNEGQGSLHTKAAAFADDWLVVGSYNMDPRSEMFDTNNLIVLRDKDGLATAAFRDTRVNGLAWTRLTPESVRQLAADAIQKSARFRMVRQLL
jgi:phosphatidylserine/phosphatidylglycerophosphate/cardiolipin synthase-like enzyme